MAASFTIAARNNGFNNADAHAVTVESVKAYREAMGEFAEMRTLDVWYANMSEHDLQEALQTLGSSTTPKPGKGKPGKKKGAKSKGGKGGDREVAASVKAANKLLQKAHTRDSLHALTRFAEVVDGKYRIVNQPPVVVPLRELKGETWGVSNDVLRDVVEDQFQAYQRTLSDDRRRLLERFSIVDMARKVVGVGSVGTRAWMVLLQGRDTDDPLFLQVKEATRSVLESHLPKTRFNTPGQRVVEGQRIMQATPDIFLGWTKGVQDDRFYYWRQLRDMKGSAVVEAQTPLRMTFYARICGYALARSHARSGDPVAIAAYLGRDDTVDRAISAFSNGYANQNALDYEAFVQAVKDGRIEAQEGV